MTCPGSQSPKWPPAGSQPDPAAGAGNPLAQKVDPSPAHSARGRRDGAQATRSLPGSRAAEGLTQPGPSSGSLARGLQSRRTPPPSDKDNCHTCCSSSAPRPPGSPPSPRGDLTIAAAAAGLAPAPLPTEWPPRRSPGGSRGAGQGGAEGGRLPPPPRPSSN